MLNVENQLYDAVSAFAALSPVALITALNNATGVYGVFDDRKIFRGAKVVVPYNGILVWVDASVGEISGRYGCSSYSRVMTREQTNIINSLYIEFFKN